MARPWLFFGGLFGVVAVILGAFAAHQLEDAWADQPERLEWVETAARYQMYHALALCVVANLQAGFRRRIAGVSFVLGIVLFSGSLYLLAFTNVRWLGAITPLGGLAFIVGWLALLVSGLVADRKSDLHL